MAGTLLYPDLVGLLIKKIAKQQFKSDIKKSFFTKM